MSGQGGEKDAGLDPWGEPLPPREVLVFCDFIAPNRLPCTSRVSNHPARHFTSDGRSWPRITSPAEPPTATTEAER